ncbi:Aldose 1-epimerase [Burkholderiales bacterium 8X]|nr:Aldose 1-epimerase [Burkholderiales bacterium 8X]
MMAKASVTSQVYGQLADGRTVHRHVLDNGRGLSLSAIDLGGIVTELRVPDRSGTIGNVVLGFAALADYEARNPHFGTIVGRCANRIDRGRFSLDGEDFQLPINDGAHSLHGGLLGFGKRCWNIEPLPVVDDCAAVDLFLVSEDGDQGYPGRLEVRVRYTLTPEGEWRIDYHARSDRRTIVNLTHHDYWNLAGGGSILGHRLSIAASRYCPVDEGLIPTGIEDVAGTPFDFRLSTPIGVRIRAPDAQLIRARGYDHNWVLDRGEPSAASASSTSSAPGELRPAARLEDPASGRSLDVETTEPGLQFYSGNFLDATLLGSGGETYRQGDGLCLETQHFPDSPNHPGFPSVVLEAGTPYTSSTLHRFGLCSPERSPSRSP